MHKWDKCSCNFLPTFYFQSAVSPSAGVNSSYMYTYVIQFSHSLGCFFFNIYSQQIMHLQSVVMQFAQSYGKVADTTSNDCCGTKILCSSFIWHRYEQSSVNSSSLHIRMEVTDIQGHNVGFKPPLDWTWSLWLWLLVIRPLQLSSQVLWNGQWPTQLLYMVFA